MAAQLYSHIKTKSENVVCCNLFGGALRVRSNKNPGR